MFDIDLLENKDMAHKTIFVRNNGGATINGLPAGKSMPLKANMHGKPIDRTWRRLTRRRSPKAVLQLSDADPSPVEQEKPAKAKAKATKSTNKGD